MPGFSFPPGFTIPTPRLQISPFDPNNPTHCAFLVQLWNTDDFISSCRQTKISSPEEASSFLRRKVLGDYAHHGFGLFLVSRQVEDGWKPIGTVSLLKGIPPDPHYLAPDIGYAILPEESGQGYATEAALGLLKYAQEALGVDAVFGFCSAGNKRSRRVLEKIGLEFRGLRALKVFGGDQSAVYVVPDMSEDLSVYGVDH
ncbi:Acyl-CoA N-acyltransferase [Penicillium sp. IBT 31633x]|nr:Acyl-CoA N-acyltransferase [Penicillium sp. IBT 31633x]